MDGKRFIRTIRLENILSYGPATPEFKLLPLNVLIGPNASGKSNLLDALSLLTAAPRDILRPIRLGGGTREWLWKGTESASPATIEVTTETPQHGRMPIRYRLAFREYRQRFELIDEAVEAEQPTLGHTEPYLFYSFQNGQPVLNIQETMEEMEDYSLFPTEVSQKRLTLHKRYLQREEVSLEQSILSQRRDPDTYPELTYLGDRFKEFRFYREWDLSKGGPIRSPQATDHIQDFLLEDGSNLGLVLNNLFTRPPTKQKIMANIQSFYPLVQDIVPSLRDGTVQIQFHEKGLDYPISSTRLSDGTLRYLCLLTVICNPDSPPIMCIEEPEIGLHPDIISEVADLLIEASKRSQIVVTTHSDILVDALTDIPESIVICDKQDGNTELRRLSKENIESWLEDYRLGEIWMSGQIGGTRW